MVAPRKHPTASRNTQGGAHGKRNATIAPQVRVTRGPHGGSLGASWRGPHHTGGSSAALAMTVHERPRERDIQEVSRGQGARGTLPSSENIDGAGCEQHHDGQGDRRLEH